MHIKIRQREIAVLEIVAAIILIAIICWRIAIR
jgi:hypothetical protein